MPMAASWVARIRKARKLQVSRESSPVCRDTSSQITASAPSPGASAVALSARSESTSSGMVTEIEPCSWTFRTWSFSTSRSTDSRASRTWMTSPGGRTDAPGWRETSATPSSPVQQSITASDNFPGTQMRSCAITMRPPLARYRVASADAPGTGGRAAATGAAVIGQGNYGSVTLMLWKPAWRVSSVERANHSQPAGSGGGFAGARKIGLPPRSPGPPRPRGPHGGHLPRVARAGLRRRRHLPADFGVPDDAQLRPQGRRRQAPAAA